MPPKHSATLCQVCCAQASKYICAKCLLPYCSVSCYKGHKETTYGSGKTAHVAPEVLIEHVSHTDNIPSSDRATDLPPVPPPLRPLTSLIWPYVPEASAYPDPLKRDDPKPLQLPQYEAIAMSPAIRRVLAAHPRLPTLIRDIDRLRGDARQEALQHALGVASAGEPQVGGDGWEDDMRALRELAEAVEAAVRGGQEDVLGLDWGDE